MDYFTKQATKNFYDLLLQHNLLEKNVKHPTISGNVLIVTDLKTNKLFMTQINKTKYETQI